jgi:RNA polymerase sigma factor (sigma-70 family)
MTGTCVTPTPQPTPAPLSPTGPAPVRTDDLRLAELVELVPAAAAGDRRAFTELVRRYRPLVTQLARRYSDRAADADDVTQEVWIKLWEHLGDIEQPEALPGWLRRVTANVAFRIQRRDGRLVPGEVAEVPSCEHTEESGIRHTILRDVRDTLDVALGRLKASDRRLLELLMIDDRPDYRAVSQLIERPVGSIGPTRQRIFQRLRRDPDVCRLAPGGVAVTLPT